AAEGKGGEGALEPFGMHLATAVESVERADGPRYVRWIEMLQMSVGRLGLLSVGDCQMASHETGAFIAAPGDFYLCPLPQVQLAEGEFEAALEAGWSGERALIPVVRERPDGKSVLIAEG